VTEILKEKFISSWSLVADLKDLTRLSGDPKIAKYAQIVLDNYKFPVQSMVISPDDGSVICGVNANELLDQSKGESWEAMTNFQDPLTYAYVKFLKDGMVKAGEKREKNDS